MKVATEIEAYWWRILCDKHIYVVHTCILLVLLRELKYERLNKGSTTNINHCFDLSIKDKKYISFLNVDGI
jgi:hypothetical protein